MKLHADTPNALNTITGYGMGFIEVNKAAFPHPVAFGPEHAVEAWPVETPADLTAEQLKAAAGTLDPAELEVLLVGTGQKQHFLHPRLTRLFLERGIGIEVMDTQAAARTYNILMAEGRKVRVALFL
ncbi:MAG: Mth938-like domain-containing protein [Pigmentiphaga sp.]|nr:Mth938-like domain-containing protein [Pigmentiphaga sp.]